MGQFHPTSLFVIIAIIRSSQYKPFPLTQVLQNIRLGVDSLFLFPLAKNDIGNCTPTFPSRRPRTRESCSWSWRMSPLLRPPLSSKAIRSPSWPPTRNLLPLAKFASRQSQRLRSDSPERTAAAASPPRPRGSCSG